VNHKDSGLNSKYTYYLGHFISLIVKATLTVHSAADGHTDELGQWFIDNMAFLIESMIDLFASQSIQIEMLENLLAGSNVDAATSLQSILTDSINSVKDKARKNESLKKKLDKRITGANQRLYKSDEFVTEEDDDDDFDVGDAQEAGRPVDDPETDDEQGSDSDEEDAQSGDDESDNDSNDGADGSADGDAQSHADSSDSESDEEEHQSPTLKQKSTSSRAPPATAQAKGAKKGKGKKGKKT
jgi:hypothetical protein